MYFQTVLYIADFSSKQINPLALRSSLVCRSNLYLIEFNTYISYFYLFSFNFIHLLILVGFLIGQMLFYEYKL